MPYSPYQQAAAAFEPLGNTAQQIVLGLAQQRYQMAQAQDMMRLRRQAADSQAALNKLHGGLYQAQTEREQARADQLNNTTDEAQHLGNLMELIARSQAGTPMQGPSPQGVPVDQTYLPQAFGSAGRLAGMGNKNAPVNLSQLLFSMQGPNQQAILGAGGIDKLIHNTPAGAISTPGIPGLPTVQGGYNLPPGNERFAPQVGTEGLPSMPQTPVATNTFQKAGGPDYTQVREMQALANILNLFKDPMGGFVDPATITNPAQSNVLQGATSRLGNVLGGSSPVRPGTPVPQAASGGVPQVGEVRKGYRYNGKFPPGDRRGWDKAE